MRLDNEKGLCKIYCFAADVWNKRHCGKLHIAFELGDRFAPDTDRKPFSGGTVLYKAAEDYVFTKQASLSFSGFIRHSHGSKLDVFI